MANRNKPKNRSRNKSGERDRTKNVGRTGLNEDQVLRFAKGYSDRNPDQRLIDCTLSGWGNFNVFAGVLGPVYSFYRKDYPGGIILFFLNLLMMLLASAMGLAPMIYYIAQLLADGMLFYPMYANRINRTLRYAAEKELDEHYILRSSGGTNLAGGVAFEIFQIFLLYLANYAYNNWPAIHGILQTYFG